MIKEKSTSEASKPKKRSQVEIDPKAKGKEKVDEPTKIQKKKIPSVLIDPSYQATMHDDDTLIEEEVESLKRRKKLKETELTTDNAQATQTLEAQSLSNSEKLSAQEDKEVVTDQTLKS